MATKILGVENLGAAIQMGEVADVETLGPLEDFSISAKKMKNGSKFAIEILNAQFLTSAFNCVICKL